MLVQIPDSPRIPGSGPKGSGTSWTPTKPYSRASAIIPSTPELSTSKSPKMEIVYILK